MTESSDFKYRAFLSYSDADAPAAKWLHSSLERFPLGEFAGQETALGPIPKHLRPIFRDREDFSAGASLNEHSIAALDASAALVVLCSPNSAKSHYVNEQIRVFKHRCPERPVAAVILSGQPEGGEEECFPPALRFELDADGRVSDRVAPAPLAADLREGRDGRDLALAKVVASLIGVASDEAYRRAERERKWQRDLSVSYEKAGDALKAQGDLPEALKAYRESLSIRERFANADPDDAGWRRDLCVSYNKAGGVLKAQGDLPEALKAYRESLSIREELARADPGDRGRRRDLSVSYEKAGDVLKAQGDLPEAAKAYSDGLAIREALARTDPGNAQWQRDLAISSERLGDLLARDGRLAEASAAFERALGVFEILLSRFGDPQARAKSVAPLLKLGVLKGKDGKQHLRGALDILIELRDANRLDARRIKWIPRIEAQIAAPEEPSHYDDANAAIEAAFEAGDFAKAAALQTELALAIRKGETKKNGKAGLFTAQQQGLIAWRRLFTREFVEALNASERGLALAPDELWIAANKAHALMFLGWPQQARTTYLQNKGKVVAGQGPWEEVVLKDFAEFEKRGLRHPQMGEIWRMLAPADLQQWGAARE